MGIQTVNKFKKAKWATLAGFAAVILGLFLGTQAGLSQPAPPVGQGLEISPPLIEQSVDPGQTLVLSIRLRNVTSGALVARGRVDDFVAAGEDGQPQLITDENAEPSPYSFKAWAAPISELTLGGGEAQTFNITVNVPADASPGGHYGVVRFTATPPELEDTGVSLSASIGTLVLLDVSGPRTEQLTLADFFTSQKGQRKNLFEYPPITFTERFQNSGNIHLKPTGSLRITNIFGQEVANLPINNVERGGNVLPASIRKFEQSLEDKTMIGRYTATVNVTYGEEAKSLSQDITFWVLPYRLLSAVLAGLLLTLWIIRTSLRRYKRRVLKNAGPTSRQ